MADTVTRMLRRVASPAGGACVLFAILMTHRVAEDLERPLNRFDEGILLSATQFLAQGTVPIGDAYQPYGFAYGLPGLIAEMFGREALLLRLADSVVLALLPALVFLWAARSRCRVVALGLAAIAMYATVVRYTLPLVSLIGFLLVADAMIRRSGGSLRSALLERPRMAAVATAVLASASWFRPEYVAWLVIWIGICWWTSGLPRHALRMAAPGVVVALVPIAIMLAAGPRHVTWWAGYALSGFRRYRGQPVDWSFPTEWIRAVADLSYNEAATLLVFTLGAGLLFLGARIASLLPGLRGRLIDRDPTGLSLLLACICALVLASQSVRFSAGNYGPIIPIVWLAIAVTPWRFPAVVPVATGAAVLALAPGLAPSVNVLRDARRAGEAWRANGGTEPVHRLRRMPLNSEERQSFAALDALWRRWSRDGSPVFVANRRNDDAEGNETVLYWFLGARPAAWPATYDPGLADRDDVQRETVGDLCASRAPVVQHTAAYGPSAPVRHRSRRLDVFLALSYDTRGTTPLWRLLLPRPEPCRLPEATSIPELRRRRAALVAADELPAAGALSVELVRRALRDDRRPAVDDVAGAVLGEYHVPDAILGTGSLGAALRTLRDGTALDPRALASAAASPGAGRDLTLMATQQAWMRHPGSPGPRKRRLITDAARGLALRHPDWPAAVAGLRAQTTFDDPLLRRLQAGGKHNARLQRIAFDDALAAGDFEGALRRGRRLWPLLEGAPLVRGELLLAIAAAADGRGDRACAIEARRRADAVPGVDPGPFENTAPSQCAGLPSIPRHA